MALVRSMIIQPSQKNKVIHSWWHPDQWKEAKHVVQELAVLHVFYFFNSQKKEEKRTGCIIKRNPYPKPMTTKSKTQIVGVSN